ncbi:hypothetical protein DITRI_Ditri02bG0168600 [Diplodiscus trichospermus]
MRDHNTEGRHTSSKAKSEEDTKGKWRKPLSCYLCDGPYRANECPKREKFTTIAWAKSEFEVEDNAYEGRRTLRLGALSKIEESYQQEPKQVLRLGMIMSSHDMGTSQVEDNDQRLVGGECHDEGSSEQSYTSSESDQEVTQGKQDMSATR